MQHVEHEIHILLLGITADHMCMASLLCACFMKCWFLLVQAQQLICVRNPAVSYLADLGGSSCCALL